jgi:hypothetical protein
MRNSCPYGPAVQPSFGPSSFEHDLPGKPVSTFPDHAQDCHQLTVTRRGARPGKGHPPIEWDLGNPRFNGQKRQQNKRYRH